MQNDGYGPSEKRKSKHCPQQKSQNYKKKKKNKAIGEAENKVHL